MRRGVRFCRQRPLHGLWTALARPRAALAFTKNFHNRPGPIYKPGDRPDNLCDRAPPLSRRSVSDLSRRSAAKAEGGRLHFFLTALMFFAFVLAAPLAANATVSPQPGDACTSAQNGTYVSNTGTLQTPGYFLVCNGSQWVLFESFSNTGTVGLGSATSVAGQVLFVSAGKVGIGTTGPTAQLQVNVSDTTLYSPTTLTLNPTASDVAYLNNSNNSAAFSAFLLETRNSGAAEARIALVATSATQGDMAFMLRNLGGAGVSYTEEAMRLDHNGNLGIGTTSPGAAIDVVGKSAATNAPILASILEGDTTGTAASGIGVEEDYYTNNAGGGGGKLGYMNFVSQGTGTSGNYGATYNLYGLSGSTSGGAWSRLLTFDALAAKGGINLNYGTAGSVGVPVAPFEVRASDTTGGGVMHAFAISNSSGGASGTGFGVAIKLCCPASVPSRPHGAARPAPT
jgi:hypothetical protein